MVPASREEALFLHVLQAREHGIFSNRVLAYSSSEQPTEAAAVLRPVDELKECRTLPTFLSCAFIQVRVAKRGILEWSGSWKAGGVMDVKYTEGGQGWRAELKVRRHREA